MNDRLLREQIKYEKEYRDFQKKSSKFSMIAGLGSIPASMMAGNSSLASAINMPMSSYSNSSRQKRLMYERQVDPKGYGGRALGMFDQIGKLAWTVPMSMALMGKGMGKIPGLGAIGSMMPDKMRTLNSSLFNPFGANKGYLAAKGSNWATNTLGVGTADLQTKAAAKMAKSLGLGSGAQGIFGSMLGGANTVASGLGSMAPMLALMGLKIGSGIMKARRIAKYKATRQSTHKIEKSHSLSGQLDGYLQNLISANQLPPAEQVKIQLLRWIESHTSVLPEIYSELDYKEQQKTKNVRGTDKTYNRRVLGSSYHGGEWNSNDDRGTFAKAFDATEHWLTRTSAKYDPISQILNMVFSGKSPKQTLKDIDEAYGKGAKLTREDKVQARNLGVSNSWQALLKRDSKTISDIGESYEEKMMNLSRAQFDVLRLAGSELVSIRRTGFGIDGNPFQNPDDTKSPFRKLVDGIKDIALNIPGLNAVGNIAKLGYNIGKVGYNIGKNIRHPIQGITELIQGIINRNKEPTAELGPAVGIQALQGTFDKLIEHDVLKVKLVNDDSKFDNVVYIGGILNTKINTSQSGLRQLSQQKRHFSNQVSGGIGGTYLPVPGHASGGIVKHPELATIAERGPEAVVPLPNGSHIPVSFTSRGRRGNRNFGTEMNEIKIAQKEKEEKEYNTDIRLTLHSIAKSLNPNFKPKSKNEKKETSLWDLFKSIIGALWSGISTILGAIGSMLPGGGYGAALGAGAVGAGLIAYKGAKKLGRFAMKGIKSVGGLMGLGGAKTAAKAATAGAGAVTAGQVGAGAAATAGTAATATTKAPGMLGKTGKFLKGVGKLGLKALGPALLAYDAYEGWNESGKYFGLKEGEEATLGQKFSGMLGNVLSLGLAPETFAPFIHNLGSGISDAFNSVPWKEIGDVITSGAELAWDGTINLFNEYAPKIKAGFNNILSGIWEELKTFASNDPKDIKKSTIRNFGSPVITGIAGAVYGKDLIEKKHDEIYPWGDGFFGGAASAIQHISDYFSWSGKATATEIELVQAKNAYKDKLVKKMTWLDDQWNKFAEAKKGNLSSSEIVQWSSYLNGIEYDLRRDVDAFNSDTYFKMYKGTFKEKDVSYLDFKLTNKWMKEGYDFNPQVDPKLAAQIKKTEDSVKKTKELQDSKSAPSMSGSSGDKRDSSQKWKDSNAALEKEWTKKKNKATDAILGRYNSIKDSLFGKSSRSEDKKEENHGFMGGIVDSMTGFIKNLFGGSSAEASTGSSEQRKSALKNRTQMYSSSSGWNSQFGGVDTGLNLGAKTASKDMMSNWRNSKDAILNAAKITGEDPVVLTKMAAIESGFEAGVKNKQGSGASGLFQFIPGTWKYMIDTYGEKYNIAPGTSVFDVKANAIMGALYVKENRKKIEKQLGRRATVTDLYTTHLMGGGGGTAFLKALQKNPNMSSEEFIRTVIRPKSVEKYIKQNGAIFAGKTLGETYKYLTNWTSGKTPQDILSEVGGGSSSQSSVTNQYGVSDQLFEGYKKSAEEWNKLHPDKPMNVTSGYRSQEYQDELRKRWASGDRSGLVTEPAKVSQHTSRNAIDVAGKGWSTQDYAEFGKLMDKNTSGGATWLGPGDKVHYQLNNPNASTPGQSGISQAQTNFNELQSGGSSSITGTNPIPSEATKQYDQKRKTDLGISASDETGSAVEEPIVDNSVNDIIAGLFRNSSESVNRNFQNYGIENTTSFV